jgi:hypothetical protein
LRADYQPSAHEAASRDGVGFSSLRASSYVISVCLFFYSRIPLLICTQTVIAGLIAYFCLPNNAATAKYLTPEEREWAMKRLSEDSNGRFKYVPGLG